MFIRAHKAGYMRVATLPEKDLPVLASGRCPYKLFSTQNKYRSQINIEAILLIFSVHDKFLSIKPSSMYKSRLFSILYFFIILFRWDSTVL